MRFAICFAVWCFLVSVTLAQSWSSFQNGGKLADKQWDVASQWSSDSGIAWQQKLAGYGQSSPIIFEDTVYITSVSGPKKETVNIEAFSIETGQRKWIHSEPNANAQDNNVMISRAASSPVADGNGIVAMFEVGKLVALDHSGAIRWQKDLVAEFGDVKARHGLSASLEQDSEHVYVWVERAAEPYVMSLNKSDGSVVWNVAGVGSTSWGSPRLMEIGGKPTLILAASGKIVGLEVGKGKRLWEFTDIEGNSSSTPIPAGGDRFFIGSSGGRGTVLTKPCTGLIQINTVDGAQIPSWVWSSKQLKSSFGSPIIDGGRVFLVNRSGILTCCDLEDGQKVFTGRLPCGSIWATPLSTGKQLYFFGKNGSTSILEIIAVLRSCAICGRHLRASAFSQAWRHSVCLWEVVEDVKRF